jgi:hypothetical protein
MRKHAHLAFIAAALLPLMAQASPVTVDAGNFTATYDTSAFSSYWSAGSYDGYTLQPSQYQVSTGANSLRIDLVALPAGTSAGGHQGASTLLYATGTGFYASNLALNLPLTLAADAAGTTAYRITIGTHLSGLPYELNPLASASNNGSQVTGSLSATSVSEGTASLMAVSATVPPEGIATPIQTIYSGQVGAGFDLSSITGSFRAYGARYGASNGTATFGIDYIQIDAITVAAVPEPGTYVLMGLGLVGIAVARRRRRA